MIEVLAVPLIIVAAALFPKMKQNDKKIIQEWFENIDYGFKKEGKFQGPKLKSTSPIKDGDEEIGTSYLYSYTPGLPVSLNGDSIANALGKPAEFEFKRGQGIFIHVYHEDLKRFIDFADKDMNMLTPEPEKTKKGYKWTVPIGKGVKGWTWHNFEHIPHMTIAGTTRFGKSVLLRLIMTYLILFHPKDVEIYVIDLKGRLEFNRYRNLKQVKGVAGTPKEAAAMLTRLSQEEEIRNKKGELIVPLGILDEELKYFEKNYISNITETSIKKRRFIIIDEGAQLSPNKFTDDNAYREICQYKLSRIAAVFGAVGARLIYATQYPTRENLNPNVKMNADTKISFRLPAGYASKVAIDEEGAEKLPSDFKGRALMKTHELKEVQVPLITHKQAWAFLERYQDPMKVEGEQEDVITLRKESEPTTSDLSQSGHHEVRHKGTDPKDPRIRDL